MRARQAADVVETTVPLPVPDQREAGPYAHTARRFTAAGATLEGPKARPVAAGAVLFLVA